jgi:4-carboxymuconolactone decarboxylase
MASLKVFLSLIFFTYYTTKHLNAQQTIEATLALDKKQQSIIPIAAFTAKGYMLQLRTALNNGLDAGLSINETKEILVQLYAYTGFPRSLNALNTLMTVLDERKKKGITDVMGRAPSPLPTNKTKLQFGTAIQTKLIGQPVKGAVYEFAPAIDQFLKEHLFADIFGRDNLDFKTREIATIAALASLGGAENQLRSHINVGMYNGLTVSQLNNIVAVLQSTVGDEESKTANDILQSILNKNQSVTVNNSIPINSNTIFPKGEKITNNNFVGTVYLHEMVTADSLSDTQVGNVTFEPGARSNWHYHPGGQIILVIDGTGYYQEKGSSVKILRKGDVIKCPPNIPHWHGASPDDEFIQVAITNTQNGPVVWLQKVTEGEYNSKGK